MTHQTFDLVFHSSDSSDSKGFKESYSYCLWYLKTFNGTYYSYFKDYKNGIVQIVNTLTGEVAYETEIL
jgi:hypothetical protein